MKAAIFAPLGFGLLLLGGCASRSGSAPAEPSRPDPHGSNASPVPVHEEGPRVRSLELPVSAGTGQPREVRVLVEEPSLKVVSIILRQGTVLPEHHAPVAVTIQALAGAGTVVAGQERLPIDPKHAVMLAPKTPHSVEPAAGTDLVLLVHHAGAASDGGEHHGH